MLSVVTFAFRGWQPLYSHANRAQYVHALRSMFEQHLTIPHRFVCVTDEPNLYECETFPIWETWPDCGWFPNSFFRLRLYSEWARVLGDTIISCDTDTIIRANIDDLVTDDPIRLLPSRDFARPEAMHYQGAWQLITPGAYDWLWRDFDIVRSLDELRAAKARRHFLIGSDQAWLSHKLPHCPTYDFEADGFYIRRPGDDRPLPSSARVAMFVGGFKPWNTPPYDSEWRTYLDGLPSVATGVAR